MLVTAYGSSPVATPYFKSSFFVNCCLYLIALICASSHFLSLLIYQDAFTNSFI